MKIEENRRKRKWRSVAWFDAVFAATTKIRVIRVAHALFKACDGETGITWSGRDRIHKLSRIADLDNFRKALKELQDMGAIIVQPFDTMPADMMAAAIERGKSKDGMWYSLSFAWSEAVLASESEPVNLTADGESDGQNDRDETVKSTAEARSNRPESDGQNDPPYLPSSSSPISSLDLLRERAREMDIDDLILEAIETKDETLLRLVELRKLRPKLRDLIGEEDYERWLARSLSWEEIVGGIDGKAPEKQTA